MKVLITGARGLLGMDTAEAFSKTHDTIALDYEELDITDAAKTVSTIRAAEPDLVLHFAALRDLDECERNPDTAYLVNTLGTRNVAVGCQEADAVMLYSSTGSVYPGDKPEPLTESAEVGPINAYGRSKLLAEEAVQTLLQKFFIVRLPMLFGRHGKPGRNPVRDTLRKANVCLKKAGPSRRKLRATGRASGGLGLLFLPGASSAKPCTILRRCKRTGRSRQPWVLRTGGYVQQRCTWVSTSRHAPMASWEWPTGESLGGCRSSAPR